MIDYRFSNMFTFVTLQYQLLNVYNDKQPRIYEALAKSD